MNHSSLCLHQSHACERKAQRTETKRRREMDGEGEDDWVKGWQKSKSCLVWVEGCWVQECLSCGVSSVPVYPADVPRSCASDCPFQRSHLQEKISETGSQSWSVCVSQTVAICYAFVTPAGCCSPKSWPFYCHYVALFLKKHCECRYACRNVVKNRLRYSQRCSCMVSVCSALSESDLTQSVDMLLTAVCSGIR